ncbi:MAG: hypothetical protein LQ351_001763 [Letrouitia transgressa]|nr:MAG: hypothetical protein LQ351_001763 [Letrouitia transgressa]
MFECFTKRGTRYIHTEVTATRVPETFLDATLLQTPSQAKEGKLYGHPEPFACLRLVTLAPELEGSVELISTLANDHDIQVSLGHSAADFDTGIAAMRAGARSLTHVFNAMSPLHHRNPGLGGLIASPEAPFYSLIADGVHLHPTIVTMAFRSNPTRCILITDALEMAGMPDGVYPGHAQIPHPQRKQGNKVVIDNTDTLIGSCVSMEDCVRNLKQWAGCSVPEAVRCATETIANLMNLQDRGILETERRADFVVLDETGTVLQTWIKGEKVYERGSAKIQN